MYSHPPPPSTYTTGRDVMQRVENVLYALSCEYTTNAINSQVDREHIFGGKDVELGNKHYFEDSG